MDKKEERHKKEKKTNVWKIATIFFGLVLVFLIVYFSVKEYQEPNNWKNNICNEITATPYWVDKEGNIIEVGLVPIAGLNSTTNEIILFTNKEQLEKILIDSEITFVYSSGCGACKAQIEQFNLYDNFWEDYKNSDLTIDCAK